MTSERSLFDAPREPVLAEGSDWITGLLGGSLAVSLCVIAMAILGMLMLTGRLHLRRGLQVVLGCFLLLGSSALATAMSEFGGSDATVGDPARALPPLPQESPMPPVSDDPYSGASLRRE